MWRVLTSSIESNDPIDEIIDILMECTSLVEQMDAVRCERDTHNLTVSCLTLRSATKAWYARLEAMHEPPLYTVIPDKIKIPRLDPSKLTFPERYEFKSLEVAEAHMLYWTALLMIYSLLHGNELQKKRFRQGAFSPADSALYQSGAEFYANQICQGVGYFIQPHMHILGGHNLLFPVSMASQFFHRNGMPDQYQWCQEVFSSLESIGLGLANVLHGTPWSRYKEKKSETPVVEALE